MRKSALVSRFPANIQTFITLFCISCLYEGIHISHKSSSIIYPDMQYLISHNSCSFAPMLNLLLKAAGFCNMKNSAKIYV